MTSPRAMWRSCGAGVRAVVAHGLCRVPPTVSAGRGDLGGTWEHHGEMGTLQGRGDIVGTWGQVVVASDRGMGTSGAKMGTQSEDMGT